MTFVCLAKAKPIHAYSPASSKPTEYHDTNKQNMKKGNASTCTCKGAMN